MKRCVKRYSNFCSSDFGTESLGRCGDFAEDLKESDLRAESLR